MARLAWSLGMISAASVGFEVGLVRVLAIVGWEAVAAQAVGIAMVGVGAAGTALLIWPQRGLAPGQFARRYGVFAAMLFVSMPLVTHLAAAIPYEPFFTDRLGRSAQALSARVALLAVPFFLSAFLLGLALVNRAGAATTLYGANLLGAGAGALSFPLASWMLTPSRLVAFYASLAALGCIVGTGLGRRVRVMAALMACALVAAMVQWDLPRLVMSQYKDLSAAALLTGAIVEHRAHGPQGLLTTVRSPALHVAPGLSLQADSVPPEQVGLFLNGEGYGAVDRHSAGSEPPRYLRFRAEAVAFDLGPVRKVLVAGSGGGQLIHLARSYGAEEVIAVESVGAVPSLLSGALGEFSGRIYEAPGVRLHVDDIRSFLATNRDEFDVILLPMPQGFQQSVMGLASLQENDLYTREGIGDAVKRLAPGGRLVLGAWLQEPPRDALKLLRLAFDLASQQAAAVADPRNQTEVTERGNGERSSTFNVLAFRTWGQVAVLLVRAGGAEVNAAEAEPVGENVTSSQAAFLGTLRRLAFDPVWAPGLTAADANRFNVQKSPTLFEASVRLAKDPEAYLGDLVPLDLATPTDDRPFFGHFWKPADLLGLELSTDRVTLEWGTLLGALSFTVVACLSAVLILAPLVVSAVRRNLLQALGAGRITIGFMAIGLGYMAVELLFLSRLTLVLHQPALAVSVALAGFLGCSGLGSLTTGAMLRRGFTPGRIAFAAGIGVAVLTPALLWLLRVGFVPLASLDIGPRMAACLAMVAPLAFLMGMPFPAAVAQLHGAGSPALLPWGFAMNGYMSAVTPSLFALVAPWTGHQVLAWLAAALYVTAGLGFRSLGLIRNPGEGS